MPSNKYTMFEIRDLLVEKMFAVQVYGSSLSSMTDLAHLHWPDGKCAQGPSAKIHDLIKQAVDAETLYAACISEELVVETSLSRLPRKS